MRWKPEAGHVPRGFLGATGPVEAVELVLVFAEPGDPHVGERHTGLASAYAYATFAFSTGKDLFHRNVRGILDSCWPGLPLDQQLERVWLTESVLCSASREGGNVPGIVERECGRRYQRAVRAPGWDRKWLPLPGSTVRAVESAPIFATPEGVEAGRAALLTGLC